MTRERPTDECREGTACHRSDIAQVNGEGLATDEFGVCLTDEEMSPVHQHVGGDDDLFTGRRGQQRGVIADADGYLRMRRRVPPNPVNQLELAETGHGGSPGKRIISGAC